jgi:hypothetical protein
LDAKNLGKLDPEFKTELRSVNPAPASAPFGQLNLTAPLFLVVQIATEMNEMSDEAHINALVTLGSVPRR